MNGIDTGDWGKVTIRTPGAFAEPEGANAALRELFCEESVLEHQRRITEAGLREAIGELRTVFATAVERRSDVPPDVTQLVAGLLNRLDPGHEKFIGRYPSTLVCPLHDPPQRPAGHPIRRAFTACPGVPRCRAHEGVRVE